MRTLHPVRILMLLCGISCLTYTTMRAQCPTSWAIKDECGPILANGGIAPNSPPIFCEGQIVTFLNTTNPNAGVTKVYMDWGDGTCESYDGNPPFFTHAYDIPDDSCVSVPSATYLLYMGVEKKCAGDKSSFHYIITPLAVSFKPVADPSPPQIVCQNEEAIFLNQCNTPSNTTTVWTSSDGATWYGETFSHIFTNPGFQTVTLTVSNTCGSDDATLSVNVTPTAVAGASLSDTTLCLPNAQLKVTNHSQGGQGQVWTITPSTGFTYLNGTGPGSVNPELQFSEPGNYLLNLQVIGCGSPSWSQIVQVNLPPTLHVDTIANSCNAFALDPNQYFTPGGGPASNFQWQFSGAAPSSFNGFDAPSVWFSGVGMHVISLNLSNFCGAASLSDSFFILPQAVASATISNTVVCIPNDTLTVTNNSLNAQGYSWWVTPNPWGNYVNGTDASSENPAFNFINEGFYTIHMQAFGCGNPQWAASVQIRRQPSASLLLPIDDGCFSLIVNPSSHISFSGGQPDFIIWNFNGGLPNSATGPFPPLVNYPDTGHFVVQAIVGNVCGSDTLEENFIIFNPTVVSAATPIDSVCRTASPVQLQAIPSGGYWSGPGVSNTGIFDPAAGLNNAWSELVYNYGPLDCRIYDTVHIYVMSIDVEAGPPLVRCENAGAIDLSGQSPAGGFWTGPGVSTSGVFDPVLAGVGSHALFYTVIDANGCPNPDALQVTIQGAPDAQMAKLQDACIGNVIDFGALSANSSGTSCDWTFGDGGFSTSCNPFHAFYAAGDYMIQFIVTNAAGCRDTAAHTMAIHDLPDASFATDKVQGCADLLVNITNHSLSAGTTTYDWAFGDGSYNDVFEPGVHTYGQAQHDTTYLLELTATNHCGTTRYSEEITVFPKPQVHFASNIDEGCTPLTVHFNNLSVGSPKSYRWYVNGILVDTNAQMPSRVFMTGNSDSLYKVVLICENDCGLDTMVHDIIVHPNTVMAFAHVDKTIGCSPFTVQMINFSTHGMFANWDFGDGNYAMGDSVEHTYTQAGEYVIQLFVNNGCGYDTISQIVTALAKPNLSFIVPPYVCDGDTLPFSNTSTDLAGFHWYFGDGAEDVINASPFHEYDAPGEYDVTLIGFAATTGCPDTIWQSVLVREVPVAMTSLDVRNGCEPFTVKPLNLSSGAIYYMWDFGDGCTSTENLPVHTYEKDGQFELRLEAMDEYGCSADTALFPLTVYPKPDLSFDLKQGPLCTTPITLSFTNTTAHADAYEWTFGNGLNSTAINPEFNMTGGPLDIHLLGNNLYGCESTLDTLVNIYVKPVASVHLEETTGCAPFLAVFENTSSDVNLYEWTFGDGQGSTLANPVYRFDEAGTYHVQLVANNDGICYDSNEVTITVLPLPEAAFSCAAFSDTTVQSNGIFLFSDASVDAIRWDWDFGDGGTSTAQNPVHRYYMNGDKAVTLIVSNQYGCLDTVREIIKPDPFGNLFVPNTFSPEIGASGAREFRPIGIGLRQFKIEIFATNGQRVWESSHLLEGQPTEAWDGYFAGNMCPPGIYWWKCSAILANGRPWMGMSFKEGSDPIREGKLLLLR